MNRLALFIFACLSLTYTFRVQGADAQQATNARAHTASPNVHVLPEPLTIPGLDRQRTIRIYLPPGYTTEKKRYPVLYMHDGQNLFDDATSFLGEWGVDETLDALAKSRHFQLIVVGIDNGAENRIHELSAWDSPKYGKGDGRQYTAFIVDVLKPYVDKHYRTKPDRANTAIMGSSLGGLISHYAIYQYPQVFGKAGILSPAYWYAPEVFDYTAARSLPADAKLYFYAGGKEGEEMLPEFNRMTKLIRSKIRAENISVRIDPEAKHNEAAWRSEFPHAVSWLFGLDK
jgi:predicted alpha/beta superfamily hydrolase